VLSTLKLGSWFYPDYALEVKFCLSVANFWLDCDQKLGELDDYIEK